MKSAQIISNREKVRSGIEVKEQVSSLLAALLDEKLILRYDSDVNHSHRDFGYAKQFKCDFVVQTIDSKFILIRASNSFRSDRAKIPFYDFIGIQQFSEFSGEIVASILLFPDGEEQNTTFVSTRKKVHDGSFFSPATHWLTFSEIKEFFANYCAEVESFIEDETNFDDTVEFSLDVSLQGYKHSYSAEPLHTEERTGSYYGRSGNKFERFLVEELNNPQNLAAYKANAKMCLEFDAVLRELLVFFSIEANNVYLLKATDTITKLKNGGSPKTDIHLSIHTSAATVHQANISVKNTTASRVSCHDYQAKDFVRVIAPSDNEFRTVVETFQEAGAWKTYDHLLLERNLEVDTDAVLNKHMKKLIEWAVTGVHEKEYLLDPKTQIADFLLTRNAQTGACKMQSCRAYIEELKESIGGARGAPFSWTYPSKQRGKRIQLKMPISLP